MENTEETSAPASVNELADAFMALRVEEQATLYQRLGAEPKGLLYAYEIPVHGISVTLENTRHAYEYRGTEADWCLINMGMTTQKPIGRRLNYFKYFGEAWRPSMEKDIIYVHDADTAWEDAIRKTCFLGGWDIGGKKGKRAGYFETVAEWNAFLAPGHPGFGAGLTECAVIPRAAAQRLRETELPPYPRTGRLRDLIARTVREETLALLKIVPQRGTTVTLQLTTAPGQEGPKKQQPYDTQWLE
jgi:hypothetical protein